MKVRIKQEPPTDVEVTSLKDGELAVVTKFGNNGDYTGQIVQRVGNELIVIGKGEEEVYRSIWRNDGSANNLYLGSRVRKLLKGTTLEVL